MDGQGRRTRIYSRLAGLGGLCGVGGGVAHNTATPKIQQGGQAPMGPWLAHCARLWETKLIRFCGLCFVAGKLPTLSLPEVVSAALGRELDGNEKEVLRFLSPQGVAKMNSDITKGVWICVGGLDLSGSHRLGWLGTGRLSRLGSELQFGRIWI